MPSAKRVEGSRGVKREVQRSRGESGSARNAIARLGIIAWIAALSLTASASPAAASVTIGQVNPGPPGSGGTCGPNTDILQASGSAYVVPAAGTVTSWSHNNTAAVTHMLTMKIFRPLGGINYMVVGHQGPQPVTPGGNTFPASIPVKPGDVLGLHDDSDGGGVCLFASPGSGDSIRFRVGNLADSQSGTFPSTFSNTHVNASAVLNPSNSFTLGATQRNKKKGTATLTVDVPNPGELTVSGKGVKAAGVGAVVSKTVTAAGAVKLLIKAKGQKRETLNETGKVNLKPKITYVPTGGDPSTQSTKLKLKKR